MDPMSYIEAEHTKRPFWPVAIDMSGAAGQISKDSLLQLFQQVLKEESLPDEPQFKELFETLYLPMANWIANSQKDKPLLVGINGAQGSGKSTLTKILKALLVNGFNKRVVAISIDDLYLTRHDRQRLASKVHPLFATRGVPGTHDVELAIKILKQLKSGDPGNVSIPIFNKAMDDRAEESQWQQIECPVDIILFEGWCVGAMAQSNDVLDKPINLLEVGEDNNKQWRRYANSQLQGAYKDLFSLIDILMMLKVPSMDSVFEWRSLQESKLKQSLKDNPGAAKHVMSKDELKRFIQHYERITRHSLKEMPTRADVVMQVNEQHHIDKVSMKEN